ncbi:hypothetical protein K7X08_023065 [Anisodus acutangulus]|uniref:MBD domain-containing protein n=1 Tax=Anisodus acutangulus TaxID=402998 RepID=A0A9Q1MBZ1_9SOLA|nr:hypothetical protein K7X08_023065 [Anisodus acutangulus]
MSSSYESNNCRDMIPYVPPIDVVRIAVQENQRNDIIECVLIPCEVSTHPRNNVLRTTFSSTSTPHHPEEHNSLLLICQAIEQTMNESEITPHQLTGRKRRLVNAKVTADTDVNFIILPIEGETHIYTIELKKGEVLDDPFGLNRKYHDMLHEWKCEKRRRPNGHYDTFYYNTKKRVTCRSVADVRRYIFGGFEKLKIEVDSKTNAVKEIKIGVPKQHSQKRKKESSNSKPAAKNHKGSSSELHVGSEAASTSKKVEVEKFMVGGSGNTLKKGIAEASYSERSEPAVNFQKSDLMKLDNHNNQNEVKPKERVCITTNFDLPEVAPQNEIDHAKEGDETVLEDTHGKENQLISYEDILAKQREVEDERADYTIPIYSMG